MKASQVLQSIKIVVESKQPVFLWGPPGVGKSQVVHQAAHEMGLEIIDIRAVLLDPVDLRGLPRIDEEGVSQWCAPSFLPRQGSGILFLDELNAAPPLVQAACYQLVLDRRVGEYILPDGWSVVAAGNRDKDRAVTHRMPSALANRFVHLNFTVDTAEWLAWAEKSELSAEIIDFISFRPSLLHSFDPDHDTHAFPTPRSWEFAAKLFAGRPGDELLGELLEGTVGKGAATELLGFLRIQERLPQIDQILRDPTGVAIPDDPSVLSVTCELVGRTVGEGDAREVVAFADRLPDEFGVLLVREAVRNCGALMDSDHFANWSARNAHVLV